MDSKLGIRSFRESYSVSKIGGKTVFNQRLEEIPGDLVKNPKYALPPAPGESEMWGQSIVRMLLTARNAKDWIEVADNASAAKGFTEAEYAFSKLTCLCSSSWWCSVLAMFRKDWFRESGSDTQLALLERAEHFASRGLDLERCAHAWVYISNNNRKAERLSSQIESRYPNHYFMPEYYGEFSPNTLISRDNADLSIEII